MVDIIHGATGAQGSPVLSALTAAGRTAIAAVRHPEAVPGGIAARQVDLASADSLASAYEGADGVFVHLPMGAPEAAAVQAPVVSSSPPAGGSSTSRTHRCRRPRAAPS